MFKIFRLILSYASISFIPQTVIALLQTIKVVNKMTYLVIYVYFFYLVMDIGI